jgi:agmatine deiminase
MPAEWEPHAGTWMAWPDDDDLWYGQLGAIRNEFEALVRTIAQSETVHLLVRNPGVEHDARSRFGAANVVLHHVPYNDVWLRDSGPIFVVRGLNSRAGEIAPVDWAFNGWGGKFAAELDDAIPKFVSSYLDTAPFRPGVVMEGGALEVNGAGVALTTRQCLLNENRNPGMTQSDLETVLCDYLGLEKILWLEDGLENDHTDGHVDTITRFASERVIVTAISENETDANFAPMQRNLELLQGFTDLGGNSFEIVTVPLPRNRLSLSGEVARREGVEGDRLPPTYCNFYITNNHVIVPVYGDPNDNRALEILRPLFPGREVVGLSSRALITGGGSFHCVTQQQPRGTVWRGE